MKVVAINGSPRGKASNTNVLVSALLKGAQEAGAETVNVFLAEKDIRYCKGCYSCWTKTPGKCVIQDDMAEVLALLEGANVIVLATPLYFNNVSGTLKVFMDRLAVTGNPLAQKGAGKESQGLMPERIPPKFVMVANCGFPIKSQFEVVSLWIKKVASLMRTELIGEIYATRGHVFTVLPDELRPAIADYLQLLESAGKEIATGMKLSEATKEQLETSCF